MTMPDQPVLIALAALLIPVLVAALYLVRRRRTQRHDAHQPAGEPAFTFEAANTLQIRQLEYTIAGLIMITSGLKTAVVEGKNQGVDIEVYRGIRVVGIVGIIRPRSTHPAHAHIRDLVKAKADMRVRTAYLVSTNSFDDKTRAQAQKAGVALIDGAALRRMRAAARRGHYAPKQAEPRKDSGDSQRWKPKKLQRTPEERGDTAPWLKYY